MRADIRFNPDAKTHQWACRIFNKWDEHVWGVAIDALTKEEAWELLWAAFEKHTKRMPKNKEMLTTLG
jgi:hypothetical protein